MKKPKLNELRNLPEESCNLKPSHLNFLSNQKKTKIFLIIAIQLGTHPIESYRINGDLLTVFLIIILDSQKYKKPTQSKLPILLLFPQTWLSFKYFLI